ncbi:lysophospholipase [Coccidioides immitis H538.4]|uniref:Lysophospholipase n=1 Tax=Coccidioides immitis H538.4 TaxID=396776 RepID=A0A0J8RWE4_COCIT|nr:lysophospholipase [Coccidioides immitis H538.4]
MTMATKTEEGWHTLPDGLKVYTKTWKPDAPPKAVIVFLHGFSDHCNAYYDFFPGLAKHGIEVRAFDQRGWGRSVPDAASRGLTGDTTLVIADIHSVLSSVYHSLQGQGNAEAPVDLKAPHIFLMGHSMGGGEVLYYMLNSTSFPPWIRGVLAYSPLVGLHPSSRPYKLTVALGRLVAKLRPSHQLYKPLDPSLMCRDPRVCEEWKQDPLCHDTGTLEGIAGMLDRAAWLNQLQHLPKDILQKAHSKSPPLWVGHGTADQINEFEATKHFAEAVAVPDKTFKAYEGAYHKLHAEPEGIKEALVKDVAEWVLARSDNVTQADSRSDEERPGSRAKL